MYNDHFGFKEDPFNLTPDSAFFFPSEKHKSALDALIYAVKERKGFVVITGEVGSGKTTVARTLLRQLGPDIKTAVITNTFISPKGVLTMILEDLGIEYRPGPKEMLLIQLNEYLISEARRNRDVVLIIDEAQNLSMQCLEEIRMLSNLETEKEKLIQIVLLGQPELRRKLDSPRLEQLRQRIVVHYHLEALDETESKDYVKHRLDYANANGQSFAELFDPLALGLAVRYAHGIPRLINKICDQALLSGFVAESKKVTAPILMDAIRELYLRKEMNP